VAELPAELERNFRGLRELDEKAFALEQQVEADCLQQLKAAAERQQETLASPSKRQKAAAAPVAPADAELAQRIEHNMNELIKLSDEKARSQRKGTAATAARAPRCAGALPGATQRLTGCLPLPPCR
jgi:LPS O-antigen subunit length determinant protein (WzzB/FepE family)